MSLQSRMAPSGSNHDAMLRFERCLRPLLPGMRGAALRLTRNPHDAEDLLQETTLRAWRFWSHYEHGSNLRAWLHRILLNTFVNGYRRARREREVMSELQQASAVRDAAAAADHAEPSALRAALSDELQGRLDELPAEFRAVLWAVAVDDLSYREAADSLGCPVGTVMSRLHRARRLLQKALRPGLAVHARVASRVPALSPDAAFRAA